MKSLRAFLLGFAMVSLCAPLARAEYIEPDGGLYIGIRGGLAQMRNNSSAETLGFLPTYFPPVDPDPPVLNTPGRNDHNETRSLEMDYGYVAGVAIGYTVLYPDKSADLRFEVEAMYRKNDDGQINSQFTPTSDRADSISFNDFEVLKVDGNAEVRSAMFNMLLDFHTPTRLTPYVGLGVGASQLIASGTVALLPFDDDIYSLSWQAIAGLGYRLSPGTMLTLEFRHFQLSGNRWSDFFQTSKLSNIEFDDWSMGVRFTF